mgnify:FL=1
MKKLLVVVQLIEVTPDKKTCVVNESAVMEEPDFSEMHKNRNVLGYMAEKAVTKFLAQFERPAGR